NKFVEPYYRKRDINLREDPTLKPAVDLHSFESFFKSSSSVRLVSNEDDILLAPEDVHWLDQTFGDRVTLFPRGGHLGNLGETPIQVAILNALAGLQDAPPVRRNVISAAAKRRNGKG